MTTKNNIPKGYKDSAVGIIPEEWEVIKLEDIGIFSKGNGVPKDKMTSQGYPCLTYGDLYTKYDFIIKNITSFINEDISKISKQINAGDICFAGSGETPQDIGKCATYLENHPAYAGGDIIILTPNNKVTNSLYVSYVINSHIGNKQRYKFAQGFSIVHIYTNNLKQIQIPLPPLNEQQKIVHILSLYDEAIEKQSKLIEKLELRKRGIMQRLLIGRTRLPGFTTPWQKVKLGEIFTERNETKQEHLPLLSITTDKGVILQSESDKKDTSNEDKSKYKRICPNDIGYNTMRMWQGRSALSNIEGIVSPAYTIVTPQKNINTLFISEIIKLPRVIYDFWSHSQGLVGDTLNCKFHDFRQITVLIPSITEQNTISNILTTIDEEINIQRKKLKTFRTQKRGLMQQLLTGKTRVKN